MQELPDASEIKELPVGSDRTISGNTWKLSDTHKQHVSAVDYIEDGEIKLVENASDDCHHHFLKNVASAELRAVKK
jgi:hypothetical protein